MIDRKIIFTEVPFIQYEQMLLDKNFGQYLEAIMVPKKVLSMVAQKTPIQKINIGQEFLAIDFLGANRQFDWKELSLVNNKSHKHTTIYDSYIVKMKSVNLTNFTEI